MQTAEFLMIKDAHGSHLPMRGVTPPEYAVLRYLHQSNAGKHIIEPATFKVTGEKRVLKSPAVPAETMTDKGETVEVTPAKEAVYAELPASIELARLRARYGYKVVAQLYPGDNPSVPRTFAEVGVKEDGTADVQKGQTVQVEVGGEVVDVPVPSASTAKLAPPTDSVPAVIGAEKPTHLAFSAGDE